MKKLLLSVCFLLVSFVLLAGKLVLIPVSEVNNLETLFANNDLKIHYYCDDHVVATTDNLSFEGTVVLDEHAFANSAFYAKVYCLEADKDEYLARSTRSSRSLYSGENFFMMQIMSPDFMPAKHDGMVMIRDIQASLPDQTIAFPVIAEKDPFIQSLIDKVSTTNLMATVQHLQDYGGRLFNGQKVYEVETWLKGKVQALGLAVEVQPVPPLYGLLNTSSNVIAVQRGKVKPNEYVVCGAHYDSFSLLGLFTDNGAPGADDNATGTATVLETARILSQYEFERSIVYCFFAAEEIGLVGSGAYAERCKQQGMNILGYFNNDMSGYVAPGAPMRIYLIYPSTAASLASYYTNVTNTYFPGTPIINSAGISGGDSDHTSFNNNGYYGIFPFENPDPTNPNIHSGNDLIGQSVNTPAQVNLFTSANLANVATLATHMHAPPPTYDPPQNCAAECVEGYDMVITWDVPETGSPDQYYIYRNGTKIHQQTARQFIDVVEDNEEYCYKITAIYGSTESVFSNTSCTSASVGIIAYNSKVKIYPNPAKDELRITNYELRMGGIEIFDITGKNVGANFTVARVEAEEIAINISNLPDGIYFIKISNEIIGKFIKTS